MRTTAYVTIKLQIEHPAEADINDVLDFVGSNCDYNVDFDCQLADDDIGVAGRLRIVETELLSIDEDA